MTVLLSLLMGALAGGVVVAASLLGRRGRPGSTLQSFIALALVTPFLWTWAWRTDQLPATFGMLAVVEIAWQTCLRRQGRSIGRS